jgi:hypothetical protein
MLYVGSTLVGFQTSSLPSEERGEKRYGREVRSGDRREKSGGEGRKQKRGQER